MSNSTKCIIISFTIAIVILSAVFGCGKRITHTTRTEIKNDSLSIKNSIELTQNATFNDIGTVKPFDPLKPMLYNGKWYYNVVIDFDRSITSENILKGNKKLSYSGSESIAKNKETQKTDYSNIWIGLSFIVGLLFIVYLSLKKYKIL